MGRIAIEITIIPSPPIQCVKLRQYKIPCGSSSILFRIEAPVVVNPDIVSKNASVTLVILPLNIYGIMPNTENNNQAVATITEPSLFPNS